MIILVGVAGAGKSVQGKLLAKDLGRKWISTGELLRSKITGDRRQDMLEGKLLADSEMFSILDEFLSSSEAQTCILDGFPRTIKQAEWLLKNKDVRDSIEAIVHINADKNVVKQRLLERGRPDDNEVAIDLRFREYESETLPILGIFSSQGIVVHEIDGQQSIDDVHKDIMSKVR